MAEFLEYLARQLVDDPDAVRVEEEEDEYGGLVLHLHVADDDVGKVIGRQGRVARALRTVLRAAAAGEDRRVQLEIALRVAALYDVHGMPWTLEAVLAELDDVDAVVFGGDIACGPFPDETLALVRSVDGAHIVRGNCERESVLDWMRELPVTVSLDGVQYCHSTPSDDMPIVTAETPIEALDELFADASEPTVVIGHTHHQFDRRASRVRVVNAGSIGMPYEGEVAAFWTMLEDGEPQFRKTPFDVERAVAALEASDWSGAAEFVAENMRAGRHPRRGDRVLREPARVSELVEVGRVGKPHGLAGAFFVERASSDPARFAVGAQVLVEGDPAVVVESKQSGGRPVIRLDRSVGARRGVAGRPLRASTPGRRFVLRDRSGRARSGRGGRFPCLAG